MENPPKVAILGAGMYGTALAVVASTDNKNRVSLYTIEKETANDINTNHKNSKYHPTVTLSENVTATTDLKEALKDAILVLCCFPVQVIPDILEKNKALFDPKVPFCSCSKGMLVSKRKFVSELIFEIFGPSYPFCVLSGPSFAEEIIKKYPTLVVVASSNPEAAKLVQSRLSNKFFRLYTQSDVLGVEIAGALKNVFAIGAGLVEGFGYGYNSKTAIIARGTKEIQTFAINYGGKRETLFGLAGIGDLMLTAFGELSRNRTFGYRLGKGETIEEILKGGKGVVEGLPTLEVVRDFAKEKRIEMPILEVIYDIVVNKLNKEEALERLMTRELEPEFPFAQPNF